MPNASKEDQIFAAKFEAVQIPPEAFDHKAHLRLAYVFLCESCPEDAHVRMRAALLAFLNANNVPADKYHETLTYSWLLAVRHFMERAGDTGSFDAFLRADPRLLDTKIMLTHYDRDTLFSDRARQTFVPPDRAPIPDYA